jgi:U3 small nucleolar RNA-associated protein 14
MKLSGKVDPWTACARTHIENHLAICCVDQRLQTRSNRRIAPEKIQPELKRIRDLIAEERWKPRLIMNLDKLYATHRE